MNKNTLLIMALLSMLLGCGNKLSGPDFEHHENKVIVLDEKFRIDYQVPGNLSQIMGFENEYRKQPKSIEIDALTNLEFKAEAWRESIGLDHVTWEYYRGNRGIEKNTAADFSLDIDIHKSTAGDVPTLTKSLMQGYEKYLNGDDGINTDIRAKFQDLSDEEMGQWIVQMPSFNVLDINGITFINWKTCGEIKGWNLEYFITPIDRNHYLAIYFKYSFSAKNSKELASLELMVSSDIEAFMKQLKISEL